MWADTGSGVLVNLASMHKIEAQEFRIIAIKPDGCEAVRIEYPENEMGRRAIEERVRRIRRVLQDGRGIADLSPDADGMTAADLVRNHERVRAARMQSG